MKFFTRDLAERCGSKDEAVAAAAEREWEAVNQRYEEHLRALEPDLPEHIRDFNNLLLHDALVLSIARQGEKLIMVLREDIPPRNLVIVTYTLLDDPALDPAALPLEHRLKVMDFQYDEFDMIRQGHTVAYAQGIIFGNGWELTLRFSDVRFTQAAPLYPFPGTTMLVPAAPSVFPQSA